MTQSTSDNDWVQSLSPQTIVAVQMAIKDLNHLTSDNVIRSFNDNDAVRIAINYGAISAHWQFIYSVIKGKFDQNDVTPDITYSR